MFSRTFITHNSVKTQSTWYSESYMALYISSSHYLIDNQKLNWIYKYICLWKWKFWLLNHYYVWIILYHMHYDIIITILYNNKNCLIFIIIFCTIPKMFNFVLIICHTISKIHTISKFIQMSKIISTSSLQCHIISKCFITSTLKLYHIISKICQLYHHNIKKFCLNFIIV